MRANPHEFAAAGPLPRRLFFYNAGFLRQPRLRRILQLAGHDLRLGRPRAEDGVVVWGRSPYALRGEAVARKYNVPLVRLEDAFLRSIQPGRTGSAPLGLMIDGAGVHFDSATPSTLEQILTRHPLDDSNLLQRARDGIGRLKLSHLSKYNIHDPDRAPPPPGIAAAARTPATETTNARKTTIAIGCTCTRRRTRTCRAYTRTCACPAR